MIKKIFVFSLIFNLLLTSGLKISVNKAKAKNNTYPIELAVPNQPLIAGEEVNFFIIINDKEAKEKINHFTFYLHSNDKNPININYHGENYIKFKEKIPTLSFNNDLQNKLEAYTQNEKKYIFRLFKNTKYNLQYPFGPLPNKFNTQIEEIKKKDNFDFTKLKAKYKEGNYRGMGYSDKSISEYFDTDFEKNLEEDKINKRIKEDKNNLQERLSSTKYHNTNSKINSEEFPSIDKNIEKIYLTSMCNQTQDDSIFYDCEADIYALIKNADSPRKKLYPFIFRKSATNMDPESCTAQIKEFNSMVRNFAKNLSMQKYPEKETKDSPQNISVPSNGNYNPIFKEYDLNNLQHSETYQKIMAGEEPGILKAKKREKKIENREFKISFKFNNEATIWNSGVINTGTDKDTNFSISVNILAKAFDKDKKEIKVSNEELYKNVYLLYEIINPKSQIYFQEGDLNTNKFKIKVDDVVESVYLQSKGPILYKGAFLETEYVTVRLVDKNNNPLSGRYLYKVHMKDASPQIEMKKNVLEVDDVADSVFKFKINDEYHDKVECTIKVPYEKYLKNHIPIIKVSAEGKGGVNTYIPPFECETNKWISIRVKPPKLSNFDMLSELNGLNMWDLQRGTMENFATDLVGFGVDLQLDNLSKKKKLLEGLYTKGYVKGKQVFNKIDKYEKTIRFLDRANSFAGDTQNAIKISQIKNNTESHISDLKKASEAKGSKTITESAYDFGISGINILQSTVGAVAMAPKHIPFVGKYAQKVTGTFSLAFDLMTNVWKGNLEYLSKEKKIDRAQEKNIPYPVMVGIKSKEGFKDVDTEVISVLYTYLEK